MNRFTCLTIACAFCLAGCGKETGAPQVPQAPGAGSATVAAAPQVVASGLSCNIEKVGDQGFKPAIPSLNAGARTRVSGWMTDDRTHSVPKTAELLLVGTDGGTARSEAVTMWRDRPDVVAARGNVDGYLKSGFSVDVILEGVAAGDYRIVLQTRDAGGVPAKCDVGRHVQVLPI